VSAHLRSALPNSGMFSDAPELL
ncbi:hypothetical protein Tco_1308187, partial [Tanacetum coccineum]